MIKFDKKDDILDKDLDDLMRVNPDDIEVLKAERDKRANIFINLLDGYYGIRVLWFFINLGFLLILLVSSYSNPLIKQFIIIPFVIMPYTFAATLALWNSANREHNQVLLIIYALFYVTSPLIMSIGIVVHIIK